MRQTSLEAYRSITNSLGHKQRMVMGCIILNGPQTNEEVSKYLHWPINTVTPRVGELVKIGLLKRGGTKIGQSGRRANVWTCVMPEQFNQLTFI